jgi:hypothetical protein
VKSLKDFSNWNLSTPYFYQEFHIFITNALANSRTFAALQVALKISSLERREMIGNLILTGIKAIANFHILSHAVKLVGKFVKATAHSNFGLIGLDRVASWLGLG